MADIIPVLKAAVSTLEEVKVHPDVPDKYRQPFIHLTKRLRVHIAAYQVQGHGVEVSGIIPNIKSHSLRMRRAARGADFDAVILHGMALMDALPGAPQSGRKRGLPGDAQSGRKRQRYL